MTKPPYNLSVRIVTTLLLVLNTNVVSAQEKAGIPQEEQNAMKELEKIGCKILFYSEDLRSFPVESTETNEFKAVVTAKGIKPDEVTKKMAIFLNSNLSDEDFAGQVSQLAKIKFLARIDLSYTKVTGAGLGLLKSASLFPILTQLDLSSTPLNEMGLKELATLSNIHDLHLNGTSLPISGLRYFSENFSDKDGKGLVLYLANTAVTKPSGTGTVIQMDAGEWLPKLGTPQIMNIMTGIDLSGAGVKDDALINFLENVVKKDSFNKLILSGNKITNESLKSVKQFTNVEVLNLANNAEITDEGLKSLASVKYEQLKELSLSGTGQSKRLNAKEPYVTDTGMAAIVSKAPNLTKLNITGTLTLVTPDGRKAIQVLKKLKRLEIAGTGIDDKGLKEVWGASQTDTKNLNLQALEFLDISQTKVTNKGLIGDKDRVGFPKLKTIQTTDTKITPGGVSRYNALRARLNIPGSSNAPLKLIP